METSSVVATWLSLAVTTVGLGGLVSQASAIIDKMDPFHENRSVEYLGIWFQRQARFPWYQFVKPTPNGPAISAKLAGGFCGLNTIHLTRLPTKRAGKAGWSILLAIIHPQLAVPVSRHSSTYNPSEKGPATVKFGVAPETDADDILNVGGSPDWDFLEQRPLVRHQSAACITISRTTLITIMILTNARKVFEYSEASGYRAGYASYNGQWYLTWPIGQDAIVKFAPHDSHNAASDVYPPSFAQRVDRCVQMLAGIVSAPDSGLQVAFCGRKPAGRYVLEHVVKGFPGAHGSRHLYNMMGGIVYDVDFMFARLVEADSAVAPAGGSYRVLSLPSTDQDQRGLVEMVIKPAEEKIIKHALDCLPWASLSWSIHRGMRDILVAYGKPVMDLYRAELAAKIKQFVADKPDLLDSRGWSPKFVRENMGDMAASAILAGRGNSGDLVRVVTEIVLAMVGDWSLSMLDGVAFWRRDEAERELDMEGVVALTKMFVLEWGNEFDYQIYAQLPIGLNFA